MLRVVVESVQRDHYPGDWSKLQPSLLDSVITSPGMTLAAIPFPAVLM